MLNAKAVKKESRSGALIGSDTNEELRTAQSQLPKCTLDYLEHGAPEGSRNAELHKHACQFRDAGISIWEAKAQLGQRASLDGLQDDEIERTIASAYRGEQREPIGRGAPYSGRGQSKLPTPKFKKIETAPEELPEYLPNGDRALLEAAFEPGEFVSIASTFENEESDSMPTGGVTMTVKEWLQKIDERGGINKIFTDRNGLFIRINPMIDGGTSDDEVTAFRHVLVECDQGTKQEQLGAIRKLGLPVTAVLDSGNKSIHAWLRVNAKSEAEYRDRVTQIFTFCEQALGMKLDPKNRNPSRYSRMADVQRAIEIKEDERGIPRVLKWGEQRLLAVNVPGKPWDEWESEVRAMAAEAEDEKMFTVEGLLNYDLENDPKSLIGNRWLCEGSSLLITGPTGVGKSSFIMTLAVDWALGERPFGLAPKRPLKTLIIQAENDEGDLATPLQGLLSSRNLSKEQISELNERIIFKQIATKTGAAFADYLRAQVREARTGYSDCRSATLLCWLRCERPGENDSVP
jgi:AAA domain-containing protein